MQRSKLLVLTAILVFTAAHASAQNLLVNPGFEDPITFDGPPFVGFWEGFSSGAGASASNSTAMPRNGAQNLDLSIVATENAFAGVFQDVEGLTPGQPGIFSGWHATPSAVFDVGVEIRIEWRNSATNTEISRTPNLTLAPSAAYSEFVVPSVVPAGADTARVVYAIQSFGPEPTNTGTVYVDDVSFVIPEPGTAGLISLLGLGLIRRRR